MLRINRGELEIKNILVSPCVIPFIGVVSTFIPLSAHNNWYQSQIVVFGVL